MQGQTLRVSTIPLFLEAVSAVVQQIRAGAASTTITTATVYAEDMASLRAQFRGELARLHVSTTNRR